MFVFSYFCSSSGGTVCTSIAVFLCVLRRLAASRVHSDPTSRRPTHKIYTNFCTYSTSWWWAKMHSKHIEATNRNKPKVNRVSWWSCYTDILRCTVNTTLIYTFSWYNAVHLLCFAPNNRILMALCLTVEWLRPLELILSYNPQSCDKEVSMGTDRCSARL
jgi:hypothetical protein